MKFIYYKNLVILFIIAFSTQSSWGSTFTNSSKLATGKWIKIKVTNEGIYEISHDELLAFGFSDPSKVRIFGTGGNAIPEFFGTSYPNDDLVQVPILRTNNKLCFYAKGNVAINIQAAASVFPRYTPARNPYANYGAYFITDKEYPELLIETKEGTKTSFYDKRTNLSYVYHEKDECSVGSTGKTFLGEDFTSERNITVRMNLLNSVNYEKMMVAHSIAINSNESTTITTKLNGELVPFTRDNSTVRMAESEYIYYTSIAPAARFIPNSIMNDVDVNFSVASSGTIKIAKLDYVVLSYYQHNTLSSSLSQLSLNQHNLSNLDRVVATDVEEGGIILNVDNEKKPIKFITTTTKVPNNKYDISCAPGIESVFSKFVYFNPNRTLNKVEFIEVVENQNLHAMNVPDMLIITTKDFIPQAQRIADFHAEYDNLDVAIVDHTKIFNEFSSGVPDATAYRLFAKMLWERNPEKFKHLLLFGGGSYDNRRLIGNKGDNYLLTYQSNSSNDEHESYTTDDYFAFLDNNAGDKHPQDKMRINVGRMPVLTLDEAKNAVDKLLGYHNTKSTAWMNNMLLIADQKDSGLHMIQAEGVETLLKDKVGDGIQINKVYAEAYTLTNGFAESARAETSNLLTKGQLFVSFIGHGGPKFLTKQIQLWRKADVENTPSPFLPFFSLATCDVARFDSDVRGIAEEMFHQPNGGLIACMASCRSVNSSDNDMLNRAFITNLFTPTENGDYITVGEAFRKAKLSITSSNSNKLSFLLLGDPAMKLRYPKKGITIKSINEESPENAIIYPISENIISGEILNADGSVNTDFNGNITATLYDKANLYTNNPIVYPPSKEEDVYFQNSILCNASATVVNGIYTLNLVTPINCLANGDKVSLKLFATDDTSGEIFNGANNSIVMKAFDPAHAIEDNIPPIITAMYLNDEKFQEGDAVDGNSTIYIRFEDNIGINSQSVAIGKAMNLVLDNNKSFPDVANLYQLNDDGKGGEISYKIEDMPIGQHSLLFKVTDLSGNTTSRSINFNVEPNSILGSLDVTEVPAREKATFVFSTEEELDSPEVTINVTDKKGHKVWSKTTSSFPCEWDLRNIAGEIVDDGVYNFSGIIKNGYQSGHTVTKKIIVIKQ